MVESSGDHQTDKIESASTDFTYDYARLGESALSHMLEDQTKINRLVDDEIIRLGELSRLRAEIDASIEKSVVALRACAVPWRVIGEALGVSPQNAHYKYIPQVRRATIHEQAEIPKPD